MYKYYFYRFTTNTSAHGDGIASLPMDKTPADAYDGILNKIREAIAEKGDGVNWFGQKKLEINLLTMERIE